MEQGIATWRSLLQGDWFSRSVDLLRNRESRSGGRSYRAIGLFCRLISCGVGAELELIVILQTKRCAKELLQILR